MSKHTRYAPPQLHFEPDQALLYIYRNASSDALFETAQEPLKGLVGLLQALERFRTRTGGDLSIGRATDILHTLASDALTLHMAARNVAP
ncbi:hypothetical protein [Pseudomonas paraeruginosa]|uniref:hypothetical protein n=1 Tax=Pseudomonas paraeruginosa TaxID=2994495 RepID=UPI0039FD4F9E|nr:hypothetical protein [Pseudomonas aeruginosa]